MPVTENASDWIQNASTTFESPMGEYLSTIAVSDIKSAVPKLVIDSKEKALSGAPEGDLYKVQVYERENVPKLNDIHSKIASVQKYMDNDLSDVAWAEAFECVTIIRSLAIHHSQQLTSILPQVIEKIVCPNVASLRSAMVRNALLCMDEMILALGNAVHVYFDIFVPVLLARASSEKHFIRDLADKALTSLVMCAGSPDLLKMLIAAAAKETKSVNATNTAVHVALKCLENMHDTPTLELSEVLIQDLKELIHCRAVKGKIAAKKCLQNLSRMIGEEAFEAILCRCLSVSAQNQIRKAIKEKPATGKISGLGSRIRKTRAKLDVKRDVNSVRVYPDIIPSVQED